MYKGTREYQLNLILTTIHIFVIACAGIFGYLDGYGIIPFVYLLVFFVNEYTFKTYYEASNTKITSSKPKAKTEKAKAAKWYMYSSASLIIWMVFMIFIPNIQNQSWIGGGSIWTMLYTICILLAAVCLILINWVRKIASA